MEMPYALTASVRPFSEVSLKDLSLKPPVSETMQALNDAFDAGGVEDDWPPLEGLDESSFGLLLHAVSASATTATTANDCANLFTAAPPRASVKAPGESTSPMSAL